MRWEVWKAPALKKYGDSDYRSVSECCCWGIERDGRRPDLRVKVPKVRTLAERQDCRKAVL